MKAWIAQYKDEDWVMLVHGETRSKAKSNFQQWNPMAYERDFIDIRVIRLPGLDNLPITYDNAKNAGFEYWDDWDGAIVERDMFVNDCSCEICRKTIDKRT